MKSFKEYFFYGNWFYGVCAVALSIEASVQQFVSLNMFIYYAAILIVTVVYYNKAYINVSLLKTSDNPRTIWYIQHHKFMIIAQWILSFLLVIISFIAGDKLGDIYKLLSGIDWVVLLIFPLVALGYYGFGYCFNLRNNGWTKPYVIGCVWAGTVTLYPVLFHSIETHTDFALNIRCVVLFFKNWLFIAMLCVLFDIKDYAIDANLSLNTYVVQRGLRKTIFRMVIPMSIIGFSFFILYACNSHFPIGRMLINTIPFIALIFVSYTLVKRRSLMYYLVVVDGLMLLKALCGILAIIYFK